MQSLLLGYAKTAGKNLLLPSHVAGAASNAQINPMRGGVSRALFPSPFPHAVTHPRFSAQWDCSETDVDNDYSQASILRSKKWPLESYPHPLARVISLLDLS